MSKVFIECKWFVFDGYDFNEMMRLSDVLECKVWLTDAERFTYDEGYLLASVYISADAEEIIKIFCDVVYPHARFVQCRLVSPPDSLEESQSVGWEERLWVSWRVSPTYSQLLERWHRHNKRIKKGWPFWVDASLPVQAVGFDTLTKAIKLAETSGISIHYVIVDGITNQSPYLAFCFKVVSYHQFDRVLDDIGRLLQLKPWKINFSFLDIPPEDDLKFERLESLPYLTYETIPDFLETLKPYL